MNNLTDADRLRLATAWDEHVLSQAEYCKLHHLSPRTLRSWRQKYCRERLPVEPAAASAETIGLALQLLRSRLGDLSVAIEYIKNMLDSPGVLVDAAAACRSAAGGVDVHEQVAAVDGGVSRRVKHAASADVDVVTSERDEVGATTTEAGQAGTRRPSFFSEFC